MDYTPIEEAYRVICNDPEKKEWYVCFQNESINSHITFRLDNNWRDLMTRFAEELVVSADGRVVREQKVIVYVHTTNIL